MNIHLHHPNHGFTLVGVIVGILLIIMGFIIVTLLKRCSQIQPRELPSDASSELEEEYPGWETNEVARPWPTHYVPIAIDMVTPEPSSIVYEKVILDNDCLLKVCKDSTMTNWVTVLHWVIGGSASEAMPSGDVPWLVGFKSLTIDGITYKMNADYSGFDIKPHPSIMQTQRMMFWKTCK